MSLRTLALVFYTLFPLGAIGASYNFATEYIGPTFFDKWVFYNYYDNLTNGDVIFVSASEAASYQLAYVDNQTNHAIIKVDNTSTVDWNYKRNSVRITTADLFSVNSVWVTDMYHVPYGCSVWPAWWSQSPNWPTGGEIDTFEGVNQMTMNQMSLHTLTGCTVVSPNETSTLITSTNCSYLANENQGCIVVDPSTDSYGATFSQAGGGVFVTEFAESGISIWFFPRASIPSSLSSNSSTLDTATLGTPVGNWPSTGCNIDQFFAPQNLIFDITLCGDWAGDANIFNETCSGNCYDDYVVGNGSDYATAYFEIGYVRVFSNNFTSTGGSTNASGGSSTSGGTRSALKGTLLAFSLIIAVSLALS